jgi:hypothetical protein
LVEEAGGGRGRERPWQATAIGHAWSARGPSEEVDEAGDLLTRVVVERWFDEALQWVDRRHKDTHEWSEAAIVGDRMIAVTAAELEELDRRIGELLDPYMQRVGHLETQPEGARTVVFVQLGFPIPDEPPP